MGILIKNATLSLTISLTFLKLAGFWAPELLRGRRRRLYSFYTMFSFMFLSGTYLIIQIVDLFLIWGDVALMTGTAFLLFTNLAQVAKILNILVRKNRIQAVITNVDNALRSAKSEEAKLIVKSCNKEAIVLQVLYFFLTFITTTGWATSAEKGQLPLRAWYPYDTSVSPAYELTYVHQVTALLIAAYLNVVKDTLVATLIAQCRCHLRLLNLSLRTLGKDLVDTRKQVLSSVEEETMSIRLRACVLQHQAALSTAMELEACFSEPTFTQFLVSLIIICVTAFQLVSQTGNLVRLLSMGTYLLNMTLQVFIYCYQGNQLSEESSQIASAAYECPWYKCSVKLRKSLLIMMMRCRRVVRLTAGGFTTLSLTSFMAIIKASYSLFTLLQQVDEK